MDRLTFDTTRVEELRDEFRNGPLVDYEKPCPASALQVDDDVMWLGFIPMRILWGHDHPDYFNGYAPEVMGDTGCNVDGHYVEDRAPADPNETPMPVWPQQAQQRQAHGDKKPHKHDKKAALKHLLSQLDPEHQKKVRALVKAKKPELLDALDKD